MKINILNTMVVMAVMSLTICLGCKKTSKNTTNTNNSNNLSTLFAQLKYQPQEFIVNAGRDTIVYGAKNTRLHFYANSFKSTTGSVITGEQISVQLTEYYTAGDMIANRLTTVCGDTMLRSGGEVNVVAFKVTGPYVNINPYGIAFPQSSASNNTMHLYYGYTNATDSNVYWNLGNVNNPGANACGTTIDSGGTTTINWYEFDTCDTVGWINCDTLYRAFHDTTQPYTQIQVAISDTSFHNNSLQVYLYFPTINLNVGMICTSYYPNPFVFTTYDKGYGGAPVGVNYECIVVGVKNNNNYSYYYMYETSGTTTAGGMNINATMQQATISQIQAQLKAL